MQRSSALRRSLAACRSPKAELQAFWSTEAGIQDLAYVTQLLLAAANAEAMAGHTGSKAVRVTALTAVCNVLEAINDAQPLSSLLPGLVGGLSKAILAGEQGAMASCLAVAQQYSTGISWLDHLAVATWQYILSVQFTISSYPCKSSQGKRLYGDACKLDLQMQGYAH